MTETYAHFYIVRHGQSLGNVQNTIQGQTSSPLTEEGEKQAARMADVLKDVHVDLVFSSDLIRAQRTAEIIALEKQLAVNTSELLREHRMGQWEGQNGDVYREQNKELLARYEELPEGEKWKFKVSDDVESDEETIARFMTFLRETAVTYPGKTILVATHGGVMRCLLVHLGWATHKQLPIRSVENTALIRLKSDGVDFYIEEVRGAKKKN